MKFFTLALLIFLITTVPSQAEPIPEEILTHDFNACMGANATPQNWDAKRAAYCNCVKNGMRGWSMDMYAEVATEQLQAQNASQVPNAIKNLAKTCMR